jgi:hypothetical protein
VVVLWLLAQFSQAVGISFHQVSDETDTYVCEHLRNTVALSLNKLALAQQVAALASAAENKVEENCSDLQIIRWRVRSMIWWTEFVHLDFDSKLTTMVKTADAQA